MRRARRCGAASRPRALTRLRPRRRARLRVGPIVAAARRAPVPRAPQSAGGRESWVAMACWTSPAGPAARANQTPPPQFGSNHQFVTPEGPPKALSAPGNADRATPKTPDLRKREGHPGISHPRCCKLVISSVSGGALLASSRVLRRSGRDPQGGARLSTPYKSPRPRAFVPIAALPGRAPSSQSLPPRGRAPSSRLRPSLLPCSFVPPAALPRPAFSRFRAKGALKVRPYKSPRPCFSLLFPAPQQGLPHAHGSHWRTFGAERLARGGRVRTARVKCCAFG